jgi:hypothetical protein
VAARGCDQSLPAGGDKGRRVLHDVIGGQRQNDRVAIARFREHRTGRDRGTRIAPHRLEQDVGLISASCSSTMKR